LKENHTVTNCDPAELVLDVKAGLGEGPVWDVETARLIWVDIMDGRVNLFDPSTGVNRAFDVGAHVGAAALRTCGGLILAIQDGFAQLDLATGQVTRLCGFPGSAPIIRMNDAKCDPQGRLWAGTLSMDMREGAGALYRLDPDGGVSTVLPNVSCSNGTDWSLDGQIMYYVDSMTHRIECFDFDPAGGAIANRRTFAEIELEGALPDGLTVDAGGNVWVALWGGSCVRCYSPAGELLTTVPVPASQASSCAFGGADLGDLYITSARNGLTADQLHREPLAGGLFRVRPGVKGRPANRFAA
jgi:sugar lactone lactonase YvrE